MRTATRSGHQTTWRGALLVAILCVTAALAAVIAPPASADEITGTIAGTITDAATGSPLEGAAVEAFAWYPDTQRIGLMCGAVFTDASGAYSFELPLHDHLILCISSEFYATQYWDGAATRDDAEPVTVVPGVTTPGYDIRLEELPNGRISGHLLDDRTKLPIHGGNVGAYRKQGDDWISCAGTIAGQDGSFSLHVLAGEYRLQTLCYPYFDTFYPDRRTFDSAESIVVGDDDTITADVLLHEVPPYFSGQVRDLDYNPLPDIEVDVLDAGTGLVLASGTSDEYGGFTVTADPWTDLGRYKLRFSDPSGDMLTEYLREAATIEAATVLAPPHSFYPTIWTGGVCMDARAPARVHGTVRDSAGDPLPGMTVHVAKVSSSEGHYTTTTDAAGEYDVTVVVGKRRDYAVWSTDPTGGYLAGYEDVDFTGWREAEVHATPGSNDQVDLVMFRSCTIHGTLTDESTGLPTSPLSVDAQNEDGQWVPSVSSGWDGTYALTGVPDGTYKLYFFDIWGIYVPRWWPDAESAEAAQTVTVSIGDEDVVVDGVLARDETRPVTSALEDVAGTAGSKVSFSFVVSDARGAQAQAIIVVFHKGKAARMIQAGRRTINKTVRYRWRVKGLKPGRYTWKVYATDPAGNQQAKATARRLTVRRASR
jgi:5-hydroxyisourate hydrolase-like protein (transthyretin family)